MTKRNTTYRNYVTRSPLLRKGGPHIKSKTGQRVRDRLTTHRLLDDWQDEFDKDSDDEFQTKGGERELPDSILL